MQLDKSVPEGAKWELEDLLNELDGESDRAAAIVGAAWMDAIVAELLSSFMIDHSESKRLIGVDGHGPLRSFANRVKTAFCLGLITGGEKSNLELVGKIRNRFAHRIHRSSFENAKIAGYCRQLSLGARFVERSDEASARELFVATISILAYILGIRKQKVAADRREERPSSASIESELNQTGT